MSKKKPALRHDACSDILAPVRRVFPQAMPSQTGRRRFVQTARRPRPGVAARASRALVCAVTVAAAVFAASAAASGEPLSIRRYGVSDGLPDNSILAIFQDSRGFLWFGTADGASRFDGYRFATYSVRDGVPNPIVNGFAEDRDGRIWLATNGGGLARQTQRRGGAARSPLTPFAAVPVGDDAASNRVNALAFDQAGVLWCATDGGLFRVVVSADDSVRAERVLPHAPVTETMAALADDRSRLWFGIEQDLVEVVSGAVVVHRAPIGLGGSMVRSLARSSRGRLVCATAHAVFEGAPDAASRGRAWERLPLPLEPDRVPNVLAVDGAGGVWLGTTHGLIRWWQGRVSAYTTAEGLSHNDISALFVDRDGNLWVGTYGGGVSELPREQVTAFSAVTGLPDQTFHQIVEARDGTIVATSELGGIVKVDGGRAVSVAALTGPPFKWAPYRLEQDARGRWWLGTERGLVSADPGPFPDAALLRTADGVPAVSVAAIYRDRRDTLWVSLFDGRLYTAQSTEWPRQFQEVDRGPDWPAGAVATRLLMDRSGVLWLAGQGLLARLVGGHVSPVHPQQGLPESNGRALFEDSNGRFWVGLRFGGVSVAARPSDRGFQFTNYSSDTGLAGNAVWCVTEGDDGRLYLGTSNGIEQLDPATGRTRHFALSGGKVTNCVRAGNGSIWIATTSGLVRFEPGAVGGARRPPPVFITRVQIGGREADVPAAELPVSAAVVPRSGDAVLLEYVGIAFGGGRGLRYRYKLEGADAEWSAPTEQRQVHFAHLEPGAYRFVVKAIDVDEGVESAPASVVFRVPVPWYRRWWFVAAVALLAAALVNAVYRARTARLVALERIRTRVATDLHDDIGSDLSMIAMVSEMARSEIPAGQQPRLAEWLGVISRTSRGLVDSMSDIVWAVNPERDHLTDLLNRMRRFAEDAFTAGPATLDFPEPDVRFDPALGPEVRREVYLVFKEAINNILRHSACSRASVVVRCDRSAFSMVVADDGVGFEPVTVPLGNGLASLRRRAGRLGASLTVRSHPGGGTTLELTLPLGRRPRADRPTTS
jgi:ligand-binding sensor domain-containing protein/signal transduction histidine kinase